MKEKRLKFDDTGMLAVKIIADACVSFSEQSVYNINSAKKLYQKKEKFFIKTLSEEQRLLYESLNCARSNYHDTFLSAYKSKLITQSDKF